MKFEEYRLSEAILGGLENVAPMKALTAACIATGRLIAEVELFVGEDLFLEAVELIGQVRDEHRRVS